MDVRLISTTTNGGMMRLYRYELIVSNHILEATVQFRFPKSKKRRIRKKWAKRPENSRPCDQLIVDKVNGIIYGSSENINKLKRQCEELSYV